MAKVFNNVKISRFIDEDISHLFVGENLKLTLEFDKSKCNLILGIYRRTPPDAPLHSLQISSKGNSSCRVGKTSLSILILENVALDTAVAMDTESPGNSMEVLPEAKGDEEQSFLLTFNSEMELKSFQQHLKILTSELRDTRVANLSNFTMRTEEWSAEQYFQFYSYLSQQQNMMQDFTRTASYQRAVLANLADFQDRVIMDVGAGSGILSFFAVHAGAKRVYAVEASNMAEHCQKLVESNGLADRIIVVSGKVEEVSIPEAVDLIISEPMGYMLLNERMLESYVHARKFLRPGGRMFPSVAKLFIAPFSDEVLFMEQYSKANFWFQQNFHGVDLTKLRESAVTENFRQPIVDTFDISICLAAAVSHDIDFLKVSEEELLELDIPVQFVAQWSGTVHGYAFWFDVGFLGSKQPVWLSTGPTEPLTHWYQVRCLFETPLFVQEGQRLNGRVLLKSNSRQSYDVDIELNIPGTQGKVSNQLDLKNPYFRYTFQMAQQQQAVTTPVAMQQATTSVPSNTTTTNVAPSSQWSNPPANSAFTGVVDSSGAVSSFQQTLGGGTTAVSRPQVPTIINPVIVSSITSCPVQHSPPPNVQARLDPSAYHI